MKILITGYSSLLAQALAKSRLLMGDEIYMTSRNPVEPFHKDIKIIQFDLSNPDYNTMKQYEFQALVLNAMTATPPLKSFHKQSLDEDNLNFLRQNIEGNVSLLQAVLPSMIEGKFGRIVNISSMIAAHPMAGYSLYGAIKSALESVVQSIAFEYGKYNITANSVRPGIVATERNKKFRDKFHDQMVKNISLQAIAGPDQIVEAINPLLSQTCYIQGANIEVSGGLFIPN